MAQCQFPVFCGFILRVAKVLVAEIPIKSPPLLWLAEPGGRMSPEKNMVSIE